MVTIDLNTSEVRKLGIVGYDPVWIPPAYLLFSRSGVVFVVRFDTESGSVQGEPVPVLRGVAMDSMFAQRQLALSANGVLAYVPGTDRGIGQLVTVDMQGNETVIPAGVRKFSVLDLSPDDQQLAIHIADVRDYVWTYDLSRQEGKKIVASDGYGHPKFSSTGMIAMGTAGNRRGTSIIIGSPDSDEFRSIMDSDRRFGGVSGWSPSGEHVAVADWLEGGTGLVPVDGTGELRWLTRQSGDWGTVFSPDGEWVAYSSNESGRYEIWIRSINNTQIRRQLSVGGGVEPVWCPCGKVYFRRGNQVWAAEAEVTLGSESRFGSEVLQFTISNFIDTPGRSYDIFSDGMKLVAVQRAEPAQDGEIHILANWLSTLE